jgi:hypothetical protein
MPFTRKRKATAEATSSVVKVEKKDKKRKVKGGGNVPSPSSPPPASPTRVLPDELSPEDIRFNKACLSHLKPHRYHGTFREEGVPMQWHMWRARMQKFYGDESVPLSAEILKDPAYFVAFFMKNSHGTSSFRWGTGMHELQLFMDAIIEHFRIFFAYQDGPAFLKQLREILVERGLTEVYEHYEPSFRFHLAFRLPMIAMRAREGEIRSEEERLTPRLSLEYTDVADGWGLDMQWLRKTWGCSITFATPEVKAP